ncbi:UBIQUITIN-CONJUGAT-2 domain-containing protein [Mycena kentingensis (nom. inval.)]|nr:UBIQUITIN-CONJUGAT-2 domain-containing protein [Mycena kentingensis (nom. inval.)]
MAVVIDEDIVMLDAPPTPPVTLSHTSASKNGHLKGRKRYNADFADLKAQGIEIGAFSVTKVRAGDDEGMIDLVVMDGDKRLMRCNLTITDTSEYPKSHSLITFTDDDAPENVLDALTALQDKKPVPIAELLEDFLLTLSGKGKKKTKPLAAAKSIDESEAEDDGSDAADYDYDYDDVGVFHASQNDAIRGKVLARMQHDFLEIVSSEHYRPGIIPFTPSPGSPGGFDLSSDYALSVSIPIVRLTQTIPAQALVAWDRRLLSTPRRAAHLVLLISGLGAATSYPPLTPQGEYARKGMSMRFQVGVCGRYKPSREHAVEAGRTFGLLGKDAEDEVREKREAARAAREAALLEWGDDMPEDATLDEFDIGYPEMEPEEEVDDETRFERFSLSSSLEALLEAQLVKLIVLRRKYKVGWAGAEREQRAMDDAEDEIRVGLDELDIDSMYLKKSTGSALNIFVDLSWRGKVLS